MSLFKFSTADVAYFAKGIYIPICFYFNSDVPCVTEDMERIYIPICFYFNRGMIAEKGQTYKFTFQYVSILI